MSERKYLKPEEQEELRSAFRAWVREERLARARYLWVFLVLFHTGARIREILPLKDEDFDEKNSLITLPRLKLRKATTSDGIRTSSSTQKKFKVLPVAPSALDEIINARVLAKTSGILVPPYTSFLAVFKKCCLLARIDSKLLQHPHAMRHSFAIYLLDSGLDVVSVKKMLGHASINSTMVYLDKTTEDIGTELRVKGLLRH